MVARVHYDDITLHRLLHDQLRTEEEDVTRHVESCEACQQKLDVLSQDGLDWDEVTELLQPDSEFVDGEQSGETGERNRRAKPASDPASDPATIERNSSTRADTPILWVDSVATKSWRCSVVVVWESSCGDWILLSIGHRRSRSWHRNLPVARRQESGFFAKRKVPPPWFIRTSFPFTPSTCMKDFRI